MGSNRFTDRLDAYLSTVQPDTVLPCDRQLAVHFGVSRRTVVQAMKELALNGVVQRMRGGRTVFRPAQKETLLAAPSSTDALLAVLKQAITTGEIRVGHAFPPVKFLTQHYKVSSTTVSRAFRKLHSEGLALKTGKTWWCEHKGRSLKHPLAQEVFLCVPDDPFMAHIFETKEYGIAYHSFENELNNCGYTLRYFTIEQLLALVPRWKEGELLPAGLLLYYQSPRMMALLKPVIDFLFYRRTAQPIPLLVDWRSPLSYRFPGTTCIISQSQIGRTNAESLAAFCLSSGFTKILFCIQSEEIDKTAAPFALWWDFLHTHSIAHRASPTINTGFCVLGRQTQERCASLKTVTDIFVKNYPDSPSWEHISERMFWCKSARDIYSRRDSWQLCVTQHDRDAVELLRSASQHNIRIPDDLSLISLENDATLYHYGISQHRTKWERVGYLLAHAIAGDFAVPRERNGTLIVEAGVVHKLTTRAHGSAVCQ